MTNEQLNHFSRTPVNIDISRSIFQRDKSVLTTFMPGRLIPVLCEQVLPGDSVSLDFAALVRMATPIHPVMDDAVVDVHFYFVPMRLTWNHWKEFMGENNTSPWTPSVTYTIPQLTSPTGGGDNVWGSTVPGWAKGSIADYLGVPIKVGNISVSKLPFRAYGLIWNNYYRDQNTMTPANIPLDDTSSIGSNRGVILNTGDTVISAYNNWVISGDYVTSSGLGASPLPVCRLHDYFSSSLPSPQRGPSVLMPLGTSAPVYNDPNKAYPFSPGWYDSSMNSLYTGILRPYTGGQTAVNDSGLAGTDSLAQLSLKADLTQATAASVNQLRNAFMLQRYYERLARGGARYFEMIRSFFNVTVPDATVQIPEFLGGKRFPINVVQVPQTSSTDNVSPQGNLAAFSQTAHTSSDLFHKSFTEHGYLIGVMCVRAAQHSYQQGIPRHLSYKSFEEFYVPTFANAPEQPILKKEIFATGVPANDDSVFGYQEAWSELRYAPKQITGEFRSVYAQSLDSYHYGDDYSVAPTLSVGWMMEPEETFKRTLAVTSHDYFLADLRFNMKWVRPLPVYSVPGLLDHH